MPQAEHVIDAALQRLLEDNLQGVHCHTHIRFLHHLLRHLLLVREWTLVQVDAGDPPLSTTNVLPRTILVVLHHRSTINILQAVPREHQYLILPPRKAQPVGHVDAPLLLELPQEHTTLFILVQRRDGDLSHRINSHLCQPHYTLYVQ